MKLVVALDSSEQDAAAIEPSRNLASAAHAEVLLLHVVNPMTDASDIVADTRDEAVAQLVAERRTYLEGYAARFEPPAAVSVAELNHGEATGEGIARVAKAEGADVLVVVTNRASSLRGVLLGSVAQDLIRLNPCPILVVS